MSVEEKSLRITIDVVGGKRQATITSDKETFVVDGLAIFADSCGSGNLYSFFWDSPDAAASGFVRSFVAAMQREDPFALQFYRTIFHQLVKVTGSHDKQYVSPEDLLRRWEAEDVYKAVQEDPKKFN